MPYNQEKERLGMEDKEGRKLDENHLVIERILREFPEMQDDKIQEFIQEGLTESAGLSSGENSSMEDDLIRFSGILMLNLYQEKEKLKKEVQETQRIVSKELPMRNLFWKLIRYFKRKL